MKCKSLRCSLLPLVCTLAAAAQQPTLTPPPIKMGLWKTTGVTNVQNLQIPPEIAARMQGMGKSLTGPQTVNTLSCITPEKWQKMFNRQQNQSCAYSNVQQSSSNLSADLTCTSSSGRAESTGHVDVTFDSDTKMHGTIHMNMAMQSQPKPVTMDSTFQGEYQGSDCQGISPDSPKIIK
jgi:hypothetical protein